MSVKGVVNNFQSREKIKERQWLRGKSEEIGFWEDQERREILHPNELKHFTLTRIYHSIHLHALHFTYLSGPDVQTFARTCFDHDASEEEHSGQIHRTDSRMDDLFSLVFC